MNFKVSRRRSAAAGADEFVAGMAEDTASYQSAIVFDVDDNAKTYLEREIGLKQANRLMSSELNIWYWDVRFFRPLQEEEFHVRVSPAGQIVGYRAQGGRKTRWSDAERKPRRLQRRRILLRSKIGDESWRVGIFTGRSECQPEAEPAGLVVHLGKTRISCEGCAVSPGWCWCMATGGRQRGVSKGAGSVAAELRAIALDKSVL